MIVLDVPYIFELVGGPQALRDLLERQGRPTPNYPAVQMWKHRSAIPSQWIPPVLYALMRQGHAIQTLFAEDEIDEIIV